MYIVERIASAILWIDHKKRDIDWDELAATLGIMFMVGLVALFLVFLFYVVTRGSDTNKWHLSAWVFVRPILASWVGVLWVRLRVWRRLVDWARLPAEQMARRLRDSQ